MALNLPDYSAYVTGIIKRLTVSGLVEKPTHTTVGPNGNVLSDIGFMLQNLTDELDAMLDPAKPSVKMPPLFPVSK
ncbi:hypothetical protein ANCDUO_04786 [Ancylostoma duodenale]|uniref:Uncharacterized protein n=1 Tax=Ancylostoma duodenale TaxID=51022 RepID=A0A0C2H079_9BILA|nr:hypothetical protein ANCDUO_04786 [Ancylostoma duodenale]